MTRSMAGRLTLTSSILFFAVLGQACRGEAEQPPAEEAAPRAQQARAPALPDTTGAALWSYLQQVNYPSTWTMWPGKGRLYRGQEPHGMLLTTYLSPLAHDALTNRAGRFPANAIVVKENYGPDSTLAALTVMYKVAGYDTAHADWFWVKFLPDGSVDMNGMAQGRVDMCIGCHQAQAANDYIFTGSLK